MVVWLHHTYQANIKHSHTDASKWKRNKSKTLEKSTHKGLIHALYVTVVEGLCVCVWEGIDQSSLIASFNTGLFLWWAEGYFSPYYSLRQEVETGQEGQGNESSASPWITAAHKEHQLQTPKSRNLHILLRGGSNTKMQPWAHALLPKQQLHSHTKASSVSAFYYSSPFL